MTKKKIGVFLARFQPLHNSHIAIINKAIKENEKTYIFIGSANKSREKRNPFTLDERKEFLNLVFEKEIKENKLIILPQQDYSSEDDIENDKIWGKFLYKSITQVINQDTFTIYYSDNPEIMLNWFTDDLKEKINFIFINRKDLLNELSATKIREALLKDDIEYLNKCLPPEIFQKRMTLKSILEKIE